MCMPMCKCLYVYSCKSCVNNTIGLSNNYNYYYYYNKNKYKYNVKQKCKTINRESPQQQKLLLLLTAAATTKSRCEQWQKS